MDPLAATLDALLTQYPPFLPAEDLEASSR